MRACPILLPWQINALPSQRIRPGAASAPGSCPALANLKGAGAAARGPRVRGRKCTERQPAVASSCQPGLKK